MEGVGERVGVEIRRSRGVDVREPGEPPREVRRVGVRAEDGAEVRVVLHLHLASVQRSTVTTEAHVNK